jgi:hypothetical protein
MRPCVENGRVVERAFAVLEALALALWVGALAGFAFVFAPVAFAKLGAAQEFGSLVGAMLARLDVLGYVCGAVALLAVLVRNREDASLGRGSALRALLLVVMLLLVVTQARLIVPAVHAAGQALGGSFDAVPMTDPRRIAYDRLHAVSTIVYGIVMTLGVVALALSVLARPESTWRRSPH